MALATYWLFIPAIFTAIFAGLGLGVRRIAGGFSGALVLPTGAIASIVLVSLGTWIELIAPATPYILGALGVAGLTQIRTVQHSAEAWWAAGASLAAFFLFGASVIASGTPTFTGYTQIVDIAHQFDLSAYVVEHGRTIPPVVDSSSLEVVRKTLGVGYPTGSQALLGSLSALAQVELAWAYQPLLALLCASLALAAFGILAPLVPSPGFRAVSAVVVSQASILVGYGQMGGIKELTLALALFVTAAHLSAGASGERWTAALPAALGFSAAFATLSLTTLPWLGVLGLAAVPLAVVALGPRGGLRRVAITGVIVTATSIPTLAAATKTGDAVGVVQNQAELGNLAEPVGRLAATGVWLTADHRFPLAPDNATYTKLLAGLVVGLILIALWVAIARRSWEIVSLAAAGAVALGALILVMGPWVELKALAVSAPISLLLACVALGMTWGTRLRFLGAGVLALLVGATLAADVMRYRAAPLAPYARLHELQRFGERFAGRTGPTLLPDFEEHGEYLGRTLRAVSPVNPPAVIGFEVTPQAQRTKPGVQFGWDLDELRTRWVEEFSTIITRRTPASSRPPGNFRLAALGRHYIVWTRSSEPAPLRHAPLSSTEDPADRNACKVFVRTMRRADQITVAPGPKLFSVTLDPARSSPNLRLQPGNQVASIAGPGQAEGAVEVPLTGRYELYVGSSSARTVEVLVDGRRAARLSRSAGYSYRPIFVGVLTLTAGRHQFTIKRGGGSLHPNDVDTPDRMVGPFVFVPSGTLHPPLRQATPQNTSCRTPLDWVAAD